MSMRRREGKRGTGVGGRGRKGRGGRGRLVMICPYHHPPICICLPASAYLHLPDWICLSHRLPICAPLQVMACLS